jgi:SAM-dependent methyltransferase
MDLWKFFGLTHADHVIINPISVDKLSEFVSLLDLSPNERVLDIACGKAELLIQLVERYGVTGDGVDLSPWFLAEARARAHQRVPTAALAFHEQDGRTYAAAPGTYDLASCLGGSWIFDGHRGTLQALQHWVRPGGLVLVGEPYWRHPPDPEYLSASGFTAASFASHAGNVAAGLDLGLVCLYALASSEDDWDRYQGLQWRAAERYGRDHPDDPDVPELLAKQRSAQETYLRWERDTLGWAIYLFRVLG